MLYTVEVVDIHLILYASSVHWVLTCSLMHIVVTRQRPCIESEIGRGVRGRLNSALCLVQIFS